MNIIYQYTQVLHSVRNINQDYYWTCLQKPKGQSIKNNYWWASEVFKTSLLNHTLTHTQTITHLLLYIPSHTLTHSQPYTPAPHKYTPSHTLTHTPSHTSLHPPQNTTHWTFPCTVPLEMAFGFGIALGGISSPHFYRGWWQGTCLMYSMQLCWALTSCFSWLCQSFTFIFTLHFII